MTTIRRIFSFLSRLGTQFRCYVLGHDWMYDTFKHFGVKWCAKCKKVETAIITDGRRKPWIK